MCALHEEILIELKSPSCEDIRAGWTIASKDTLRTMVRMFVDIARHRIWHDGKEGEPSPCCFYSLRTARKHADDDAAIDDEPIGPLANIPALSETFGACPGLTT